MAKFDLDSFLPYLLNQAAERTGVDFQAVYQDAFGLSRTQWRIMANIGQSGPMTASEICKRTLTEKSRVSRSIVGLAERGLLRRERSLDDRRAEILAFTPQGTAMFLRIGEGALAFNEKLRAAMGDSDFASLLRLLETLRTMQPVSTN
ncbi:MAG TPA: MarR family transcriptional regulator [Devosia sp.]|nr:MarR family transcriptional regulator [Devosia sp.]